MTTPKLALPFSRQPKASLPSPARLAPAPRSLPPRRSNKALLYYYFKSKEKLYQAVLIARTLIIRRWKFYGGKLARQVLLRYVGLHFNFISARHRHAPLFQQFMSAGGKSSQELIRKYFTPRSVAFGKLLERGMRDGEFRRADKFHTAASIVALIVFYFSSAPMLQMLGHADAFAEANLKRRKQEVLDFSGTDCLLTRIYL